MGAQEQTAVLYADIPTAAEGILLRMSASVGETWVDVSLDGNALGSARVTGEWRAAYLPLGESEPLSPSSTIPQWQAGHYYPAFPKATGRIYAIRVNTELARDWIRVTTPDWRINQSFDLMNALTLVGMQGIINRMDPSVYLVWEQSFLSHRSPAFYLEQLKTQADVVELDLDTLSAIRFLYRRYAPFFQGAVIYDPRYPTRPTWQPCTPGWRTA